MTGNPLEREHMSNVSDRYTDGEYLERNSSWHVEDSVWKARTVLRAMDRNGLLPKTLCEVGSGAGEILNQLHGRLPTDVEFTGYDISPQAHSLALPRAKPRLSFKLADFLNEKTERFDLLLVLDVVEHVDDYLGFLRALRGRASTTVLFIPMDLSVYSALGPQSLLNARRQLGHLHYFNKATALATIEGAGFEVLDHFFASRTAEDRFPKAASIQRRVLLRAHWFTWHLNEALAVKLWGGSTLVIVAR